MKEDVFVEALEKASRGELSGESFATIQTTVNVLLRSHKYRTNDFDLLVDTVVDDLLKACTDGVIKFHATSDNTLPINPRSFALQRARWRASDHIRSELNREATTFPAPPHVLDTVATAWPTTDNDVARQFKAEASAALVAEALKIARSRKDHLAYIAACQALDLIETSGKMPTTRELGEQVGKSHTGVRKALKRFRQYLDQARHNT